MDSVVFSMTAATAGPGTPMAHWDGASVAFETLGVELDGSKMWKAREKYARFKLSRSRKRGRTRK